MIPEQIKALSPFEEFGYLKTDRAGCARTVFCDIIMNKCTIICTSIHFKNAVLLAYLSSFNTQSVPT